MPTTLCASPRPGRKDYDGGSVPPAADAPGAPAQLTSKRPRRPLEPCCDLAELGEESGRFENLEIGAGQDDLRRQCLDRVGAGAQRAALVIQRFEHPAPARNPPGKLRRRALI